MGNTGGSGQGILPEIRLSTLSGTLLTPDHSGYLQAVCNWNFRSIRVNLGEARCKDQRSILVSDQVQIPTREYKHKIMYLSCFHKFNVRRELASYGCNLDMRE
eukprot:14903098-Ditylum_brightwellii.AAC.1